MPIEIRELVIKATIGSGGGGGQGAPGDQATGADNNGVPGNEEMINTCIEKILEILKEKNDR
ncbi:MAG TPA: DUF5908 family protein [Flavisolibacter sp.]|jgi:hypothetical protein